MTGKTHLSCGILVGAGLVSYYDTDIFTSITLVTLAALSSIFPDICHTRSKVGRKFKLLSWVIRLLFGHRTFTHSLSFIAFVGILLYLLQTPNYYATAIIAGMISHIILDMLTPRGVKLLYPLPINVKFPVTFKTGGAVDTALATALTIGAVYLLFSSFWQEVFYNMLK
ncbi:metal-dependent hydrolase [Staphylococcus argensis]|uniref:Metal-dependent hydrolase n=1 Tax=Staphylococcus argensis TaxID=1607738 RepID=A0A2K4FBR1_9STAP|nr:metal-dependent hydrolase [Staphylococcus argensis]MCY6991869.1 metal-dependent hydrolase [Staphylococcus argensis]POA08717.1 hypothetical protein CD039_06940 [Staphylococcus argensis]